jgi:hypothetical protein
MESSLSILCWLRQWGQHTFSAGRYKSPLLLSTLSRFPREVCFGSTSALTSWLTSDQPSH